MNASPVIALHLAEQAAGKQWVHLLPTGTFTGIDGRGPYDASDLEGIVLRSRELSGERRMVVDYNHATDVAAPKGGASPAAGWIVGMQARQDGIYGLVEWTPQAAREIEGQQYRYLSPVIRFLPDSGKVLAISRAALTNAPNLDQLTGLFSEQETQMNELEELLAELRKLLNLPASADRATILAAVTTAQTAHAEAVPDPTKYVPIGDYKRAIQELNKVNKGVDERHARERVEEAINAGQIAPFMRDWAVGLCMASLPEFESFVSGIQPTFKKLLTPSHASGGRLPPSRQRSENLDPNVALVATQMGLPVADFAAHMAKVDDDQAL